MKNNTEQLCIDDELIGLGTTSVCSTMADEMLRQSGQELRLESMACTQGDKTCPES